LVCAVAGATMSANATPATAVLPKPILMGFSLLRLFARDCAIVAQAAEDE